jgi:hypothetical protein
MISFGVYKPSDSDFPMFNEGAIVPQEIIDMSGKTNIDIKNTMSGPNNTVRITFNRLDYPGFTAFVIPTSVGNVNIKDELGSPMTMQKVTIGIYNVYYVSTHTWSSPPTNINYDIEFIYI